MLHIGINLHIRVTPFQLSILPFPVIIYSMITLIYILPIHQYPNCVSHYSVSYIYILMAIISDPAMMLPLFIFLFLLSHCTFSFSKHLEYQTLIPLSLPLPQPLTWDDNVTTNPAEATENMTFTLQLHHIDSLFAGHANLTAEEVFRNRLQRIANRMEALSAIAASKKNCTHNHKRPATEYHSPIMSGQGNASTQYFTRIGFGTPARYSYLLLDTGSDLIWIQCKPCTKCSKQSDAIFNPKKSSTFAEVACNSTLCQGKNSFDCNDEPKCTYQLAYGDGTSSTTGELSTETLTLSRKRVKNIVFGCSHDNEDLLYGMDGLIGLGRGRFSFTSQAGKHFGYKFSYCLVDQSVSSKPSSIMFGDSAISKKAVFTPLITNPMIDTFYYVGLTGISVGGHLVSDITPSLFEIDSMGNGGVIIDSGSPFTLLTKPAYDAMNKAFRTAARHLKLASSSIPTCYNLSGVSEVNVPTMSFHFNKAKVELAASNILIPIDNKGTHCLAIFATPTSSPDSKRSIIGNTQQHGFRVMFDLTRSRVGFSKHKCA